MTNNNKRITPFLAGVVGEITPPPIGYPDIEAGGLGSFLNTFLPSLTLFWPVMAICRLMATRRKSSRLGQKFGKAF